MLKEIKVILHNKKQYILDLKNVKLKPPFRGRPIITSEKINEDDYQYIW